VNIIVLDTGDPIECSGGQGVFVRNVVTSSRHAMTVAGTVPDGITLGRAVDRSSNYGTVRSLPIAHHGSAGRRPFVPERLRCAIGALRYMGRVPHADMFYVSSAELLLGALLWRRGRPVVFQIHGAGNALAVSRYRWARTPVLVRLYDWLWVALLRRVDLILSVDDAGCDRARSCDIRVKCAVLPPMYDESLFCSSLSDRQPGRLIYAGRLEEAKHVEMILRAVGILRARGVEVSLDVVGDGSERAALEALAVSERVSEWCTFLGWVPQDELAARLRRASLFVLASRQEGVTTAVLESLACGTPAITRPIGGLGAVITQGVNGRLWTGGDVSSLADEVADALSQTWDPAAVSATVSRFSRSEVIKKLDAQLEDLQRQTRSGRDCANTGSSRCPKSGGS